MCFQVGVMMCVDSSRNILFRTRCLADPVGHPKWPARHRQSEPGLPLLPAAQRSPSCAAVPGCLAHYFRLLRQQWRERHGCTEPRSCAGAAGGPPRPGSWSTRLESRRQGLAPAPAAPRRGATAAAGPRWTPPPARGCRKQRKARLAAARTPRLPPRTWPRQAAAAAQTPAVRHASVWAAAFKRLRQDLRDR
jgi:hypothetical protein